MPRLPLPPRPRQNEFFKLSYDDPVWNYGIVRNGRQGIRPRPVSSPPTPQGLDKLSEQLLLMTQIIFTLLEFIEMMTLAKLLLLKLQVVELN